MFLVLAAAGQLQPRAGLSVVECAARRPVGETAECIRSASTAELLQQGHAGQTVLHVLVGSLASFKAGDFSRLEAWSNPGDTTRYRHDVTNRLAQTIDPLVAEVLQKAPELSKMANSAGTTPLHLCALVGAQRVTRLLLDAGASPLANSNEGRTPIDDAMRMGQTELLAMMLNSLSGQARQEQEERAAQFASLPGSPLIPSILKDSGLRHLPRAPPRLDPPPSMTSVSGAACAEGGGWDVAPEPSEEQRTSCDIDQRDPSLGADEYMTDYFSKGRPVLIRNAVPLSDRCGLARDVGPMRAAQQVRSPCGRTAYPSLTGQDFCGRFSYLDLNAHPACADKGHTLPICVRKPGGGSASINVSGSIWKQLPACFRYEASVPPMPVLARPWVSAGAHQLFAGGNGSGAALHFHSAAYNAVFFGTKHWLLTPPRYAGISGAASTVWRDSHAPRDLPRGAEMPFRCTQGPGDIVVVPNHWGHATVNEAFSIGIGDLFCDSLLSSLVSDVSPGSGSDAPHGSLASIRPRGPSPLGAGGASRPVRQPPAAGCEKGAANYSTVAFVHVNKAGGTMMRAALLTYAGHQLLETGAADAVSKLRSVGARFFHASGSLQQWAVGQAAWVKAYKFALVRNPWSRQVSMFHFLLQKAGCQRRPRPADCDQRFLPEAGPWLSDPVVSRARFREWLIAMHAGFPPGHANQHLFGSKPHGNARDAWFNASQLSWMVDAAGTLLVDDVFKLEELSSAWPILQRKICGLQRVSYERATASLVRNPSSHGHYSFYYDDRTREIVVDYMRADLGFFGYQFEKADDSTGKALRS